MKRYKVYMLIAVMVVGLLAGCSKENKQDINETVNIQENSQTLVTDVNVTPETEDTPTPIPEGQDKPTAVPEEQDTSAAVPEEPDAPEITSDGQEVPEDGTDETFMKFLNGETQAYSLGLLCSRFTENGTYDLKDIIEAYQDYLEERDEVELVFSSVAYAFIEGKVPDDPLMVLRVTYVDPEGNDAPHIENMIFESDGYRAGFVGNYETCYRTYANIGTKGYISVTGSNSAAGYSSDIYYMDSYNGEVNYSRFLYTVSQEFCLPEVKIPNSELPTDSALWQDEELSYESGMSYELERFSFSNLWYVPDEEEYNRYLRNSFYIFFDEDDNYVEPDAEYTEACARDGIVLITEEELAGRIRSILEEYGVTEDVIRARVLEDEEFTVYEIK